MPLDLGANGFTLMASAASATRLAASERPTPRLMARQQPGREGSAAHFAGELLNQRAAIDDVVHTPYKGGAPVLQDLLGGRVTSCYSTPATAEPQIISGMLLAIATTRLARSAFMSNVPTVAESGLPGFNASNWYAFDWGRRRRPCWRDGTENWSRS